VRFVTVRSQPRPHHKLLVHLCAVFPWRDEPACP
jgi:hypothetical protein